MDLHLAAAVKPRLRGVSHQWAFFCSLVAGGALVALAPSGRATLVAAIYAASLSGLFGASALYHRVTWSDRARQWMRRLDHSMIFVLIAGTYTPVALLVLGGTLSLVVLIAVWTGAVLGVLVKLAWLGAPRAVAVAMYLALGWVAVAVLPDLVGELGAGALALLLLGGLLYTIGALVYAVRRPNPRPTVFGYHEVFHLFVIAAAISHYALIAAFIVPRG